MLLSAENFPSDVQLELFATACNIAFVVKIVVVAFTLTVMMKSQTINVKLYHYYLLSAITWSTISDSLWSAVGVIEILPLPCLTFYAFGAAITQNEKAFFGIVAFFTTGRMVIVGFELFYRISQSLHPQSRLYKPMKLMTTDHPVIGFCGSLAVIYAMIWVPMLINFPEQAAQRQLLIMTDPEIEPLLQRMPHILCFAPGTETGPALLSIAILLVFTASFTIYMLFFTHHQIKCSKRPEKTKLLHLMLLKSFAAQVLVLITVLCLPLQIMFVLPYFLPTPLPKAMLLYPDELPPPEIEALYRLACRLVFVFTSAVVAVTLVVMTQASVRSIKTYHYYMLTEVICSYICDLILTAAALITLQPLPCVSFIGVLGPYADVYPKSVASLAMFIVSMRCVAVWLQGVYRIGQSVPPYTIFYQITHNLLHDYAVLNFLLLTMVGYAGVWGPMWLSFPDQQRQRSILLSIDPSFSAILQRFPHTVCFAYGPATGNSLWFVTLFVIAVPASGISILVWVSWLTKRSSQPEKTIKLHTMLLRSLLVQITVLLVFLCLPAYALLFFPAIGMRAAPKLSMCCAAVCFLETNIECVMTLYFVKPYRVCCARLFRDLLCRKNQFFLTVRSRSSTEQ
ncbi:unnamed protein product [Bursaphelenchus xylophilus]|uniref:(pine wood nematode) hypothetical protein n=1 Tax=Bursaphelenchus xylophilus TaxID=6326 RepID=A0A1I7S6W3_BURXY|nr:unnamed protein product [Bursaphelenchus xylophilus]CAG9079683.1 unnamed protein product [Bursaphelenchus xylophilus]